MRDEAQSHNTGGSGKPGKPKTWWDNARLAVLLYPFAFSAMAINIFLLGLMGQSLSLPALSPVTSLCLGLIAGVPAACLSGRWVRSLIERAERER